MDEELRALLFIHRNEHGLNRCPQNFSHEKIKQVSSVLQSYGYHEWSKNPRIYTALYAIDEQHEMGLFLEKGVNDMCLPYDSRSFPGAFKTAKLKNKFLKAQKHVLSTQNELSNGKHLNVQTMHDLSINVGKHLGKGAESVEVVEVSQDGRAYAIKLMRRGTVLDIDLKVLRKFEIELQNAKKVRHHHVVQITASFTDVDHFGIVMGTVGEHNLTEYLLSPSKQLKVLKSLFICLASGLKAIHGASLRHKDIKPENIVLRGNIPYYTDFGLARDFEGTGSTTTGVVWGCTRRYAAPEVTDSSPRNTSSDLWSLGAVFLEIATVLFHGPIAQFRAYLGNHGTTSLDYSLNPEGLYEWINIIRQKSADDSPLRWIESLIEVEPRSRPKATELFETIAEDMKRDYTKNCVCRHCIQEIKSILMNLPFVPRPSTTPSVVRPYALGLQHYNLASAW
ncbi:kinase-like protein [Mytilinidion resinicola]|uniref:Kinase-like protein n=1 Tax=Mytilinidion resinicola TaxID=574789 RepID=A0A6A6Y8R1_9PEZI|nr:kinase-like protein [Mytilinidion resinicola]KAF2804207.1 kinase-like protein [Mytilinidion resinicola]